MLWPMWRQVKWFNERKGSGTTELLLVRTDGDGIARGAEGACQELGAPMRDTDGTREGLRSGGLQFQIAV